jgi:CubicO group peptidase (beta-lactamase class C family)
MRVTAVASALLAASLGAFSASADMQITSKTPPSFDKSAFEQSAHQALKGKVMGYSFLIMKDGKLVAEGAGGNARNKADGLKPMTTSTPQNLGSLFKFISGVSMLHILETPPAGSAGGQGSFASRLDAPAALLYPQIWQNAIETPAIRTITFRQLLQHRSGFRCGDPMDCFSGAFDASLIGKRKYENINFQLTGYLIGVYTKSSILTNTNAIANSTPVAERDNVFKVASGLQMDSFINDKVFKLVPGKISASCDAANEYKNTGAYAYKSAADKSKGIITSRMAEGKPCLGSGGYWMSIRDFANFAAHALHSNKIISASTRKMLYNDQMAPDDRLVWSFTKSNAWIKDNFGMTTIVYSGGDQNYGGGQAAHTAIVRLPLGYEVLVFANSDELGSSSLANIGIAAFKAGMADNF